MYIALASTVKDVKLNVLEEIARAVEFQLMAHYAPFWQSDGVQVRSYASPSLIPPDNSVAPLLVLDGEVEAAELGFHEVDKHGRPYGRCFWGPLKKAGGTLTDGVKSLSVSVSHEALEMVANPYVNFWVDNDIPGCQEALEICDRVQDMSYKVMGGISVSNFLGPRAFRKGEGPYDYMRMLRSPFEISYGGFAIYRDSRGVVSSIMSPNAVEPWKKEDLESKTSRASKRKAMVYSLLKGHSS